jgi:hypothetical protein
MGAGHVVLRPEYLYAPLRIVDILPNISIRASDRPGKTIATMAGVRRGVIEAIANRHRVSQRVIGCYCAPGLNDGK